ncbi:30S ribosomal protein S20 [Sporosalibacterium faouarense]|uniref:30S ribosomal protein S20 n=1 Tax=Sporosalibacterium faouarense TaxID=516123 RepID=UPI00141C06DB|nr:30S ribosomal protein S20 [Sporosalibacterium faouarense]MTI49375.1 30S ribosomal protein S20 [Bacillota bacterium]
MANIKSAKKRIDVIKTKTAINKRRKTEIKTYINKFNVALENNDIDTAKELIRAIERKLDKAAARGTVDKKAASRKVSRLAKRLNNAI